MSFKQLISVFSWLKNICFKPKPNVKEKAQMLKPTPPRYI